MLFLYEKRTKETFMIDISIIIPHKNIPRLLERCIDSIPVSSNMEVIIIDDNSDENHVDFENFPGMKRPDTKVIFTKEGKGAGYARNIGLKHAIGKWILFADADDFFLPNAFKFTSEYLVSDYDIIFFSAIARMSDNLNIVSHRMDFYINKIKSHDYNSARYNLSAAVLKLFKHQLISDYHIQFEEILLSNDALFSCTAGINAKKIKIDDRELMCITQRNGSLVFHNHNKEERIIRFNAYMRCNALLKSIGQWRYCQNALMLYFGDCNKSSDLLNIKYLFAFFHHTGMKSIVFFFWALKAIILKKIKWKK